MTRHALTAVAAIFLLTSFSAQSPVAAEEGMADSAFTSTVLDLNKIPPAQNPQYRLASRITDFRLLDQNRRSLGKVTDVTFAPDGKILSIDADVTATGFSEALTFDAASYNVVVESDSFTVALTREQVENNLPNLLGDIETASGEGEKEPITAKSLIGARVRNSKGDTVARVSDVLVDDQKRMAVALLLTLMGGSGQSTVAVPYRATKIERNSNRSTVELTDEQAKIATAYARK